jgi:hypothetical protein
MIIDTRTEFQIRSAAITGTVGAQMCTNSIDLGDSQIVPGLRVVVVIDALPGSVGHAATVKFDVVTAASDAGLSAGSVIATTGAIAEAALTAGRMLSIPLDSNFTMARYLGLRYTIGTEDITSGGTFSAYLSSVLNPVSRAGGGNYADGV